eukprot:scaffold210121_cov19-Prasinocladus_malaysianus.AAC.1
MHILRHVAEFELQRLLCAPPSVDCLAYDLTLTMNTSGPTALRTILKYVHRESIVLKQLSF